VPSAASQPEVRSSPSITLALPDPATAELEGEPEEDGKQTASGRWARACKRFLGEAIAAVVKEDASAVGRGKVIIDESGGTIVVMAAIRGERPLEGLEAAATLWDHKVEQTRGWLSGGVRNSGRAGGTLTLMKDAPKARRDAFEREARRALDRCIDTQPKH
jgi:hypothetical protein